MKSSLRLISFFSVLLFVSSAACAQVSPPVKRGPFLGSTFSMDAPLESALITAGVPLSYQTSLGGWHALADGTHITDPTRTQSFWRDSLGRTRTERALRTLPHSHNGLSDIELIEIRDPVLGVQYVFNNRDRIAYQYSFKADEPQQRPAETPNAPSRPPAPKPDSSKTMITTESLGSQIIEGVYVEGTRTTTVFPAGSWMGNDRPITRICDKWYSPQLQLTVLDQCSQPPNSETVNRLTNISRTEPDPTLFRVPPGYSIVDGPDRIKMNFSPPMQLRMNGSAQ